MGFLCSLAVGDIVAWLAVLLAIEIGNLFLAGIDGKRREVHTIGTHVSDMSVLIEVLGNHHRLTDGESKFAGSLLLQC